MSRNLYAWIILLSLTLIWGSSFILIKKGLEFFGPQEVGSLRIVITFLFLLPLAFGRFRSLSRQDWITLSLVGLIGSGAPAFLFAAAQTGIDSSLAGVLNSLTPLFTLLIGVFFFHFKVRWINVAGVLIALAGAIGLIQLSGGKGFELNIRYAILVILATICYATNVNLVKARLAHLHQVTITVFSFFIIGFPVLLYLLFFTPIVQDLQSEPSRWAGIGYIALLGIFGTGLALIAFNKLIKMASPIFAASVTYMIPVVALFWGIADGEEFTWHYMIWILLIIGGVFLVNRKPKVPKQT